MTDTITILSSAALSTALSTALVVIFRSWISERIKGAIQHEYNEKFETYKVRLKSESDKDLELLTGE
jgi:hypothetical protein